MKYLIPLFLSLISLHVYGQGTGIEIGRTYSFESKILEEKRSINVYLPHSYHSTTRTDYPVIYLMDGDYNFHYLTGLIDQLAVISEKIPEMIVVGFSDKGRDSYVSYCTPRNKKKNPNGKSALFLEYILNEVKPYINATYRTSAYDVLVGQSIGGLFTLNAMMENPESFENYIAISPAVWWNDFQAEKDLKKFFKKHKNLDKKLFLSVGNEKGMGILGFQNQIDINDFSNTYYKKPPLGLDYEFTIFKEENHNSVGLMSIKTALEKIFEDFELPYDLISDLNSFKAYEEYMKKYRDRIGYGFQLPKRQFKRVLSVLYGKDKESLDKIEPIIREKYKASLGDFYNYAGSIYFKDGKLDRAKELLYKSCEEEPQSLENLVQLAEVYVKDKKMDEAKNLYTKALTMAKDQKVSTWYLNQLESYVRKVSKVK